MVFAVGSKLTMWIYSKTHFFLALINIALIVSCDKRSIATLALAISYVRMRSKTLLQLDKHVSNEREAFIFNVKLINKYACTFFCFSYCKIWVKLIAPRMKSSTSIYKILTNNRMQLPDCRKNLIIILDVFEVSIFLNDTLVYVDKSNNFLAYFDKRVLEESSS